MDSDPAELDKLRRQLLAEELHRSYLADLALECGSREMDRQSTVHPVCFSYETH